LVEGAKALLNVLIKRGFEAYFIGGKCRNDLHNQYHETKVSIKDIDIVTNATIEDLKKTFPNCTPRGESFQVAAVVFGGNEFEVATYRMDVYTGIKGKIEKPVTKVVSSLDDDRQRRDFTINAIAQDTDGKYVDYIYHYRNKKISAVNDLKEKIIRAIGNPKQRFEEDPLRILRAFRFMAQLGYEIEKNTIAAITSNLKLLELVPHERIGMEMNKLLAGNFAYITLTLMDQIGFFELNINNSIDGKQRFLPQFCGIPDEHVQKLTVLNLKTVKLSPIELWAFLLQPLGSELAKSNLESFRPLNNDDIERVVWLIDNYELINSTNFALDIFYARTGIIKRHKLPCMKELLMSLYKIHSRLNPKYLHVDKKMLDAFCSRPYFEEQLAINGDQLIEMTQMKAGPWISEVKERILLNLINEDKFPRDSEKYDTIVKKSIEEVLGEKIN
jgi:tRNA nucleotidyltransferase (CCA-adding enzyme)